MAVDPGVVDSILGPYRQVLADLASAGSTGIEVTEMTWAVGEMERLATILEDPAAYSAGLANLGLFNRFNDAYNRVLASWPTEDQYVYELPEMRLPSDEELLGVILTAHLSYLERVRARPDDATLTTPLREVIDLARGGASYPVWMRYTVEHGYDLLVQGQVAFREQLAADLAAAEADGDPARAGRGRELLRACDELAAASPFGGPDPFAFELRRQRIDAMHEPLIAARDALIARWKVALALVAEWLDAFCSYAPGDQHAIERARECNPGFLAVRERLLTETWSLSFDEIFDHPTFAEERAAGRVPYDDDHLVLLRDARQYCVPGGTPAPELIERAEKLHTVLA